MAAKGVVVEETEEGVDEEAAAKLKSPSRTWGSTTSASAALEMVATNLWSAPDYDSLSEEEKGRYNKFAEAYISKCEARGQIMQSLGPT